jgi:hypothetical protein
VVREAGVQGSASLARARLARAGRGAEPIVVGPWLSEVGFELLYWIPFLRRWRERRGIAQSRLVVVSRGGAEPWYDGLCERYVDLYDLFGAEDLHERQRARIAAAGGEKHTGMTDLDREALRRVRGVLGLGRHRVLHPSVMYRRFRPVWMRRRPTSTVFKSVRYAPLPARPSTLAELPRPYVAVKAYYSDVLPPGPTADAFFAALFEGLSVRANVVRLGAGGRVDDHVEVEPPPAAGAFDAGALAPVRTNLAVQSEIVAGADALYCTYGGMSYLGPLLGTPTVSFYERDCFNAVHLDVMRGMIADLDRGSSADVSLVNVAHGGRLGFLG